MRLLSVPIPGPVVGLCLLLLGLLVRRRVDPPLQTASAALLAHLSLLFVPAGVGLMVHIDRMGAEWLPIAVALVVSTLIGMVVTALVMQGLLRWAARGESNDG